MRRLQKKFIALQCLQNNEVVSLCVKQTDQAVRYNRFISRVYPEFQVSLHMDTSAQPLCVPSSYQVHWVNYLPIHTIWWWQIFWWQASHLWFMTTLYETVMPLPVSKTAMHCSIHISRLSKLPLCWKERRTLTMYQLLRIEWNCS